MQPGCVGHGEFGGGVGGCGLGEKKESSRFFSSQERGMWFIIRSQVYIGASAQLVSSIFNSLCIQGPCKGEGCFAIKGFPTGWLGRTHYCSVASCIAAEGSVTVVFPRTLSLQVPYISTPKTSDLFFRRRGHFSLRPGNG